MNLFVLHETPKYTKSKNLCRKKMEKMECNVKPGGHVVAFLALFWLLSILQKAEMVSKELFVGVCLDRISLFEFLPIYEQISGQIFSLMMDIMGNVLFHKAILKHIHMKSQH